MISILHDTIWNLKISQIPVQNYLTRLEKADFNAFDPKLQLRAAIQLPWQIWLGYYKSSF